jgi:hypothetical protein
MNKLQTPILPGLDDLVKPFEFPASPHEFKVTALRESIRSSSMSRFGNPAWEPWHNGFWPSPASVAPRSQWTS